MRMLFLPALIALAGSVRVPDEAYCRPRPASTCRATQDYVIVADNSWSMEDNFQTISQVMKGIVDNFDMNVNNTHSPRVGCLPRPASTPVTHDLP